VTYGRHVRRHCVDVDFQTDGKRRLRTDAAADTTEAAARDRAVQVQRVGPELLVAERVVSEDPAPFVDHLSCVVVDGSIDRGGWRRGLARRRSVRDGGERCGDDESGGKKMRVLHPPTVGHAIGIGQ